MNPELDQVMPMDFKPTMKPELDEVIPIDFKNAVELPNSHTWFQSPINSNSFSSQESVPLIDLDDPQAMDQIKMACENWGMFQVINHGVPVALLAEIEHQARRFFELPSEQKLRALRSPPSLTGYGISPISRFFNRKMWSEGFAVVESPVEIARRVWPQDYSAFCDVIEDYRKQMMDLSEKIVGLMFKSLGVSREDVEWFEPNRQALLQLNSYPNCPDATRAMGLAEHKDSSLITLVYQTNTCRSLQVYRPDLNWVEVEPISNAIIVNVGDLMQITSNGQFKSPLHRAIVCKTHHRISVSYFVGPNNKDAKISPPPRLIKDDNFPMYRPISWKEYFDVKGKYYNKALEMILFKPDVEKSNALTNDDEALFSSKVEAI